MIMKRSAEGSAKWVIADVPTYALAQEAKMSLDEYSEFLFKKRCLITSNLSHLIRQKATLSRKATYYATAKYLQIQTRQKVRLY